MIERAKDRGIRCCCGKLVAIERDGKIFVQCKNCKKQVELKVNKTEPRDL